ncbi:hypothetical protein ASC94_09090 [Massilia sp. Root418]|uniref:PRTRC system protein F n=1 Tax=Massilia sp. Root418 TaxID=1736532 RepID=UPI0006F83F51|nr:PRTRC system protein F [Massilia sp. Root418]KQW96953.1 hypothetical protein ASC94_09090 [Massilia sp. Root418]
MMQLSPTSPTALPRIADGIPFELYIPGETGLAAPLALALLEAGVVTDDMLVPGPNARLIEVFNEPDEREMSMHALTTWWTALQVRFPTKQFRWDLHVQQLEDQTGVHADTTSPLGWFCITRNQNSDIPRVALARGAGQLESCLEGFGQTVLAVLYDCLLRMPESLNPMAAADWAEALYWQESENDEELIQNAREDGRIPNVAAGADAEDDTADLMTRARFYADMPRWAAKPQRVASREAIVRAARGEYEKSVIAACDAIAEFAARPGFNLQPWHCGTFQSGHYTIDGCMVLLWRDGDVVGAVIDDWLNDLGQCGEYVDFIDERPVHLNAKAVKEYMARTEKMIELAALTERLIELIGEPI